MRKADMLIDLWHSLPRCDNELLPRRHSITIAAIAPILSHCWQMHWRDKDEFTIKLMGEKLIEAWGRDMSGRNLFSILPEEHSTLLNSMIAPLFEKPCGLQVTRLLNKGEGGQYELTNLSLPMLDGDGGPSVVFGTSRIVRLAPEKPYSGKLTFTNGSIKSISFVDLGFGLADARAFAAHA